MTNILFVLLNVLLALAISTVPLRAQQVCYQGQDFRTTTLKRLSHDSEISLDIAAGDSVYLSSDSGSKTLSGSGFSLGVKPSRKTFHLDGTSDAADLSAMFVEGSNTVQFHAINEPDGHWWLIVHSPCPAQKSEVRNQKPETVLTSEASGEAMSNSGFRVPSLDPGQSIATATAQHVAVLPTNTPTATETPLPTATATETPLPTATMIATQTPTVATITATGSGGETALHRTADANVSGQSLDETQQPTLTTRIKIAAVTLALTSLRITLQNFRILIILVGLLILTIGAIFAAWRYRQSLSTAALRDWAAQARASSRAVIERFSARISR